MTELSPNIAERARNIESLILQQFSRKKASAVALDLGVSDPTICRWKSEELARASQILASLDLKVVTESTFTADYEIVRATELIALEYFKVKVAREKEQNQIIENYRNQFGDERKKATNAN